MPRDRAALGEFLRSRRDRLTPAQAGIAPFPGPRRVPGLRREELAVLAGVSPDYYSRVEQGRQPTVSEEVLAALSRALRLDPTEDAHLRDLARPTRSRRVVGHEAPQRPDPGLLRVMGALDHVPSVLLGRRAEVLATNALLDTVLGRAFEPGASFPRWLLQDPAARERIANWDEFAPQAIASLRRELGRRPDDRRLVALVDELRALGGDVARCWDEVAVRDLASLTKRIVHPVGGTLVFGIENLTAPRCDDQVLVVYTVEADSPTARVLPMLRSWAPSDPRRPQDPVGAGGA